jgi:CheY-like chemotaxis protein
MAGPWLVVDDNATHRQVLCAQISGFGTSCTSLARAEEVLPELVRAGAAGLPYRGILLDFSLPEQDGLTVATMIRRDSRVAATPIILLSLSGMEKSSPAFAAARFDATIDKPVREKQLRRTILRVLSRGTGTPTIFPIHSSRSRPPNGLRLLLVEDNRSNQLVASLMLDRYGHQIDIVNNGKEALVRLREARFDGVLMDCQMPEMDGYETTRKIRSGEVIGLNPRIPIIALTAHAMISDRAKCIAAGMDDYVSKPLEISALQSAFARCGLLHKGPFHPAETASTAGREGGPDPVVLDAAHLTQLLELRGPSGENLAREVALLFRQEMPPRLASLESLLAAQRGEEAARAAHTLAGSCSSLGAKRLRGLAQDLETAAKGADWANAAAALKAIRAADTELTEELLRLKIIL